jgi:hypothetical protein
MSTETKKEIQFKIAHVLFMDIVGYSKLLINEQSSVQQQLNQIVRNTDQFRDAEAADKLIAVFAVSLLFVAHQFSRVFPGKLRKFVILVALALGE